MDRLIKKTTLREAMDMKLLENIGLTSSEVKVYLALLELGSTSTGKLVDKADVASSKIYEILDKLIDKGLTSFIIKSGVKHFEAAPPERILDYVEEKKNQLNEQEKSIAKLIPELELKRTLSKYKSEAKVYKGFRGVETAFYDALNLLKKGEEFLVFGVPERSEAIDRFFVHFAKNRAKRGIYMRALFAANTHNELQVRREHNPLSEIKFLPQIIPSAINIFKDRVIIFPQSKDTLLIVIDSKEVAESFRIQFETLWNQDAYVYQGMEGLHTAFGDLKRTLKKGEMNYTFLVGEADQELREFFIQEYKQRAERGIITKTIFTEEGRALYDERKQLSNWEGKVLPDAITSPATTTVYGSKVILRIGKGKELTSLVIDNKNLAEAFKQQFNMLWNQDVHVYKGFDAVTNKLMSMLTECPKNEKIYILGASTGGHENINKWFKEFHKARIQKNIHTKTLSTEEIYDDVLFSLTKTGDPEMKTSELKKLPPEFSAPMEIHLYPGNKVLLLTWGKELTCFEMESKEAYDNFKTYFDALWKQDVMTYRGLHNVKQAFYDALDATPSGETTYNYGASTTSKESDEFFYKYNQKRAKKGVRLKIIFNQDALKSKTTRSAHAATNPLAEIKIIPQQRTPTAYEIFPDRVLITTVENQDPVTVVIKSKTYVETCKIHFDNLWHQDTITYKGKEGAEQFMESLLEEKEAWFIGGNFGLQQVIPEYWDFFKNERIKRKQQWHDLIDTDAIIVSDLKDAPYYEYRILPPELKSPHVIAVFGNSIANILWAGKNTTIFVIHNPEMAASYRNYHAMLWKTAQAP